MPVAGRFVHQGSARGISGLSGLGSTSSTTGRGAQCTTPYHGANRCTVRLSSAARSRPVNLPSTCTSAVRRTPPPGAASACTRSTVLRGATPVRVSAREDEGKLRCRPTPTPHAPFAHEHPHHQPPDEREQAQRPAHHAADARSCGPEGLATLRDLCARRPPVVHEPLDNGPDLGHAAPRPCLIRVCLEGMHVLYPRAQVYGRGALPAAVGRMLRAPRWAICKFAHSVLLVAKSRPGFWPHVERGDDGAWSRVQNDFATNIKD